MSPREAGQCRNTALLALDHARDRLAVARYHGLETGPWRKAIRDARAALRLAERRLVRA